MGHAEQGGKVLLEAIKLSKNFQNVKLFYEQTFFNVCEHQKQTISKMKPKFCFHLF